MTPRLDSPATALADAIDGLLPQTQCGKCGYPGCRPYADAITGGLADINQCLPGAEHTIADIAALLGVPAKPLDPRLGAPRAPAVAFIQETHCIGCTLCIQACPVDAIVGAAKLMHTVIREACTGCELCLPPCPVDCIRLFDAPPLAPEARAAAAAHARRRFEARNGRLERERVAKIAALAARRARSAEAKKKATLARAIERARQRLASAK